MSRNGEFEKARNLYKSSVEAGDGITTITEDVRDGIREIAQKQGVFYVDAL